MLLFMQFFFKILSGMAINVDPDQIEEQSNLGLHVILLEALVFEI